MLNSSTTVSEDIYLSPSFLAGDVADTENEIFETKRTIAELEEQLDERHLLDLDAHVCLFGADAPFRSSRTRSTKLDRQMEMAWSRLVVLRRQRDESLALLAMKWN